MSNIVINLETSFGKKWCEADFNYPAFYIAM